MSGISFPLSIRPSPDPATAQAAAAWFVPGPTSDAWLAELAGWGVPLAGLRLYVVPTSLRDRRPCGVLAAAAGAVPQANVRRARPYARVAGRLFIPADTRLEPPVPDDELRWLLRHPVQVLHPSAGLVGFGDDEAVKVSDLLAPPQRRDADWDRAIPGPPPPPRLASVEPDAPPPSVQVILSRGKGDIGTDAPEQLPPSPRESSGKDLLNKAQRPGLRFISWLTNHAPGGAAQPTWVNSLQDWANDKLGAVNAALAAARHKELQRLREMMKSDPDRGLRYAIPLSGGGTRGAAPPGARLGPRDVNYDPARLGGGSPGDAWDVPWEIQQELIAQYRSAANRELALGRHRRAAYVFAELLGDFDAAASALKQGRHYREAAALYRERLKNPRAAAECLEHGGLLPEAAALYEELTLFEKAAELHARLERPDDAARCWRAAADAARTRGETVHAARLLETKLAAPDEALALLDSAWPSSDAAGTCLREWFDLLGRLGRHEQAARRAARMRDDDRPGDDHALSAAKVLDAVAAGYPDASARTVAADAARVIAGLRLASAGRREVQALADVVAHLAPHDRLLARDAARFVARRNARPATPPALPAQSARGVLAVHQFRLPEHIAWRGVVSAGSVFYAWGEVVADPSTLFLVRGKWDGVAQGRYWKSEPGAADHALLPSPFQPSLLVLPLNLRASPRGDEFPQSDAFPERLVAGTPAWMPRSPVLGACVDDGGTSWLLAVAADGLVLSGHRANGSLLSTRTIEWPASMSFPLLMAARSRHVFVASLTTLLRVSSAGAPHVETLRSAARGVAVSAPFTRVRVAIAFDEGGDVYWDDGDSRPFGEGLVEPVVAFARGGALVALSKGVGRAYRTEDKIIKHHATFTGPERPPLAVVATDKLHHFATFGHDGLVRVFQLTG